MAVVSAEKRGFLKLLEEHKEKTKFVRIEQCRTSRAKICYGPFHVEFPKRWANADYVSALILYWQARLTSLQVLVQRRHSIDIQSCFHHLKFLLVKRFEKEIFFF